MRLILQIITEILSLRKAILVKTSDIRMQLWDHYFLFLMLKAMYEKKRKYQNTISSQVSYSGGMYPNVPTRRVCNDVLPTSVSLVKPKSATYKIDI